MFGIRTIHAYDIPIMRKLSPEYFGYRGIDNNGAGTIDSNANIERGNDFAQPMALKKNDVLANGQKLINDPRNTNDGVSIIFKNNNKRYIPVRLPLQLGRSARNGVLPQDLQVGDILQTGCVVLAEPTETTGEKPYADTDDQYNIGISLSGGQRPQVIATPEDLYLARFGTLRDLEQAQHQKLMLKAALRLSHLKRNILERALGDYPIFLDKVVSFQMDRDIDDLLA